MRLLRYATCGGRVLRPRQDHHRHELGDRARRPLLPRGPDLEAHDRARHLRADRLHARRRRRREDGTHARGDARAHQGLGPAARAARSCARRSTRCSRRSSTPRRSSSSRSTSAAGRKTVIISSSPIETVEPLGEHLGVDDVIATRARLDDDGRYTGELEFYAYGPHKAEAIREMAVREGIDLAQLVRVLRLDHRPADARARRQSGRGEPRPRARARRTRAGVGDAMLPASGAAARSGAGAAEGPDDRGRQRALAAVGTGVALYVWLRRRALRSAGRERRVSAQASARPSWRSRRAQRDQDRSNSSFFMNLLPRRRRRGQRSRAARSVARPEVIGVWWPPLVFNTSGTGASPSGGFDSCRLRCATARRETAAVSVEAATRPA